MPPRPQMLGNIDDTADVSRRLAAIDSSLDAGLEMDARLQSGVPAHGRANELDFIQMTGLTRGPGGRSAPRNAPDTRATDFSAPAEPLSFYEPGVTDVDSRAQESRRTPDVPAAASNALDALKALVREMDTGASAPGIHDADTHMTEEPPAALVERLAEVPTEIPAPDELDSLIDAAFQAPAEIPAPAAPEIPPQAAAASEAALREAEELLAMLSAQPREDAEAAVVKAEPVPAWERPSVRAEASIWDTVPAVAPHPGDAKPDLDTISLTAPYAAPVQSPKPARDDEHGIPANDAHVYTVEDEGQRVRRRRRTYSRRNRALRRLAAAILFAGVLGASGIASYRYAIAPALVTNNQMYASAQRAAARGRLAEASQLYTEFAARYPGDARRADAQFEAGLAMQMAAAADIASAPAHKAKAIALFARFVKDNPGHARAGRATALMGIMNLELGHDDETIRLLRDPSMQADDPALALPILRALGAAYRKQGMYREAQSAYEQAASLPHNLEPDKDYQELGAMLRSQSEKTDDAKERRALEDRAIEAWGRAASTPGIDPLARDHYESQSKALRAVMGIGPDDAKASPALLPASRTMTQNETQPHADAAPGKPEKTANEDTPAVEEETHTEAAAAPEHGSAAPHAEFTPDPAKEAEQIHKEASGQ